MRVRCYLAPPLFLLPISIKCYYQIYNKFGSKIIIKEKGEYQMSKRKYLGIVGEVLSIAKNIIPSKQDQMEDVGTQHVEDKWEN